MITYEEVHRCPYCRRNVNPKREKINGNTIIYSCPSCKRIIETWKVE